MAADNDAEVQQHLAELSARVASLEAALARLEAVPAPVPEKITVRKETRIPASTPAPRPNSSLESRIGAQLLNRIGIVAVLIGVAWFLKLAFDRNWIGPSIRIWIGLIAAAGVVLWSERFRSRGYPAFAYSLKALGTSIAYLSLWAAASLFHLAPFWLVFLAMTAVTVSNAVLAHRQNSEILGLYALAGGFATPTLLSVGPSEIFLFGYLGLLCAGAFFLVANHAWKRLAWASLIGTLFYCIVWGWNDADASHLPTTALFLGLFFAAFAIVPWFQKAFSPIAFPIANVALTWLGFMALFAARPNHVWRSWATCLLAAACLAVAFASRRLETLFRTNLALAIVLVTLAVPLALHDSAVRLGWLAEALLLVVLARVTGMALLRIFATCNLGLSVLALLVDWVVGTPHPQAVAANMHFYTNMVATVVFATVTVLSLGRDQRRSFGSWNFLAGLASIAFSFTALVTMCLEIHHYWFCGAGFFQDFCGGYGQLERRTIAASWGYSACCMGYGAAFMAVGFWRRSALLRWQALVVLALSIAKVFLNGVSQQSQGYRVLSFLALGILLLTISFAYQKDWLRLRNER
jgi:uncharacterized membrane protein